MKTSILSCLLMAIVAAAPAVKADVESVVALQQAQLETIKSSLMPVGTIVHSLLTEAQFNQQMAMGQWVLLDGRNVADSQFAKITGRSQIPDAKGRFLRMVGGKANSLGNAQDQGTAKNGLSLQWASSNVKTSDISNSLKWRILGGGNSGHNPATNAGNAAAAPDAGNAGDFYNTLHNNGSHTHTVNKSHWNSNQQWGGDTETRPVNLSVNYFIRIN